MSAARGSTRVGDLLTALGAAPDAPPGWGAAVARLQALSGVTADFLNQSAPLPPPPGGGPPPVSLDNLKAQLDGVKGQLDGLAGKLDQLAAQVAAFLSAGPQPAPAVPADVLALIARAVTEAETILNKSNLLIAEGQVEATLNVAAPGRNDAVGAAAKLTLNVRPTPTN